MWKRLEFPAAQSLPVLENAGKKKTNSGEGIFIRVTLMTGNMVRTGLSRVIAGTDYGFCRHRPLS